MDRISLDRIAQRAIDVATLKTRTYSEIARDPKALVEAAIVVVAVAISAGIGAVNYGAGGLITGIILSLLGWVISSAIIYVVATRVTGTPTTSGSIQTLLRTLGYASAPNIFSFLGFIWIIGGLVLFALSIWTLITTIFDPRRARHEHQPSDPHCLPGPGGCRHRADLVKLGSWHGYLFPGLGRFVEIF